MKPDQQSDKWWNAEMFGGEEPAVAPNLWSAVQNPRTVLSVASAPRIAAAKASR